MKLHLKQEQSFSGDTVLPQSDRIIQRHEEALAPIFAIAREKLCEQTPSYDFESLDLALYYLTPALRDAMLRYFSDESQQRLQDLMTESQQRIIDPWLQVLIDRLVQGNRRIEGMLAASSTSARYKGSKTRIR